MAWTDHQMPLPDILPRLAEDALRASMRAMPVTVLMGARQTGKSTLVQTLPDLRGRPYLTLDDLDVRAQAQEQPNDLVGRAAELILDEVQREPDLMLAIKRAVDNDTPRRPGRFVLTGSANLLLMSRISESLAGRASYVPLWPMTRRELLGQGRAGLWSELLAAAPADWPELLCSQEPRRADWKKLARLGGFPTPAHEHDDPDARAVWFAGYVQTYLERDLQTLSAISSLADFRRLMRAAALRIGGLVNQAEMPASILSTSSTLWSTEVRMILLELLRIRSCSMACATSSPSIPGMW